MSRKRYTPKQENTASAVAAGIISIAAFSMAGSGGGTETTIAGVVIGIVAFIIFIAAFLPDSTEGP